MTRFQAFSPGDRFPELGAVVLAVVHLGTSRSTTRYWVRNLCCDREQALTHKALLERKQALPPRCRWCARAWCGYLQKITHRPIPSHRVVPERSPHPHFAHGPTWPVPPSLRGRSVYELARF